MSETPALPAAKILLVDDLPENLIALEALLRAPDRTCHLAHSGEEALALMLEHEFALALLDVQMPSMNGFELAELMRGTERTRRIPIVFVTAAGRELNHAFRGYESGAVDFLHKPLDPHTVRSKVAVFVELYQQRQALQAAHEDLQRSVRMRDDFMSMVSHELRTPLNTLFLQAQLRQRLLAGERETVDLVSLRRMAERDDRQIRSMIRLIDDMLDVSRLRTGRLAVVPTQTDLAELVRQLCDAFTEQAAGAGASIEVETPPALLLECDPFRIEQVLTNLLTNALRYGQGSPVQVRLQRLDGGAELSVKDGGIGIPPEDQARIFEQFERADSALAVKGLGLGLFISRQIVGAHGGRISVKSEPGDGACFTVFLPNQAAAEPPAA